VHQALVATDDPRIADVVRRSGGEVVLSDTPYGCGTQRVAHAADGRGADFVLNVQVDQAFVDATALARVLDALRAGASIATLAAPLPPDRASDPHAVKVVRDGTGHALYFSRTPIPGDLHLGVYGFNADTLASLAALPRSRLATAEDLEQLTWLEAGWPIVVVDAPRATLSIDTPEDLVTAQHLLAAEERSP